MELETFDVGALINQGDRFQEQWSKFMFNLYMAMELKRRQVTKEQIIEVLTAGSAYLGGGWTTGRSFKGTIRTFRGGHSATHS